MAGKQQRDKTKVNPLSGAEDQQPAAPLESTENGKTPNATNVEIPGTGEVVTDINGKEAKRVVTS